MTARPRSLAPAVRPASVAVVLAVLVGTVLTGEVNIAVVLGAVFLLGIGETFADTTTATLLPMLVAKKDLGLANARLIDSNSDTSTVSVGSRVRLRDLDMKETVEYHIVGSAEANPAEQKLSNESPVGKAIIGRKKGETVEVLTPRGSKLKFKIMEIKAA